MTGRPCVRFYDGWRGRVAFATVGVAFVDAGVPADGRVRGDLAHAQSRDQEGSPGSFVPGVGDSRRDVVSRARCLSRVRWADAPERGGVVQARPSAVRGFLERRDGLPSQGALHALRRERPGARTVPCARAHGHAGARPSGRGPAGLRADAHGRRPGHRIVPPGRQGDRLGAAGVPAHAAHARRRAGALPARRTLASARGGRVQAARRAPVRDRGPRPGERARALAGARQTALGARGVLRPGRRRMDGRGRGRGLRREQRLRAGLPGALPPTSRSCSTASTWSGTSTRT